MYIHTIIFVQNIFMSDTIRCVPKSGKGLPRFIIPRLANDDDFLNQIGYMRQELEIIPESKAEIIDSNNQEEATSTIDFLTPEKPTKTKTKK